MLEKILESPLDCKEALGEGSSDVLGEVGGVSISRDRGRYAPREGSETGLGGS